MMMVSQPDLQGGHTFEELRDRSRRAVEAGRLEEALGLLDDALEVARREGTEELVDLALCNRGSVLILLGRHGEVFRELREILVRNRCAENCFLAAYNLSRAHVRDKEYKKALFYARIARDRAEALGRDDWRSASYTLVANCLMDESFFEEAAAEYRKALALLPDEPSLTAGTALANLGYCSMMLGQLREGFRLSFRTLRWFRRLRAPFYEVWPRFDLCYAYIEIGRYDRALRHGKRALELAEASGDPGLLKIALYLRGELERAAGNHDAAYDHFLHLQRRFYQDSPELVPLMVAVDMRQMVNLRA
jgi:tetratricopeptide (TPR) repeat protein